MKYHFIGLCGAGMSMVAKILKDAGHTITGSDIKFYPPISDFVRSEGWECRDYAAENITDDIDVCVISGSAGVKFENNIELQLAKEKNIPIRSFAEILSEITSLKENIVVAGSYGKSTTTSIVAWLLENAGKHPGYFIGAIPKTPSVAGRYTDGQYFVLEGDEYKTSNLDEKSKFLHYHPDHVLLTSLAHDHMNIYPTHDSYLQNFFKLFEINKKSLTICVTQKDIADNIERIQSIAEKNGLPAQAGTKIITYGADNRATYYPKDIEFGEITSFDIYKNNDKLGTLQMQILGRHNIENFVGAFALLYENNILSFKEIVEGVLDFKEVTRRLDVINQNKSIKIYEGFGSSYDKCRSAIAALRDHFPDKNIKIIFEPASFSWRRRMYLSYYKDLFEGANLVYIYDPKKDDMNDPEALSYKEILDETKKYINTEKFISAADVATDATSNDIFLILTSGNLGGAIDELKESIDAKVV